MPYGTAYSRQQRKEAISEKDAAKNKIDEIQMQLKSIAKDLYAQVSKDNAEENKFVGWLVIQRFRCKTGGGLPTFGDYVFGINKDMTECIFYMSKEEFEELCSVIDQMMSVPEDELMENIENYSLLEQ